jgi:hypothetical protein
MMTAMITYILVMTKSVQKLSSAILPAWLKRIFYFFFFVHFTGIATFYGTKADILIPPQSLPNPSRQATSSIFQFKFGTGPQFDIWHAKSLSYELKNHPGKV